LYAWFNFPDFNSIYSCHFYLAGLSQQQKLQRLQLTPFSPEIGAKTLPKI
jgi:hypothetical protein